MGKKFWMYVVDMGLIISFLGVVITGIIKFRTLLGYFDVSLSFSDAGWGLLRTIHDWSGLVMAILVLIHLILNWGWIVETTKEYFKKKENLKEIPK